MTAQLTRYISLLSSQPELLKGILHGIEKESLRISPDGKLSQESHPIGLGSALTNSLVTTDFAESLVEFITPVSDNIDETLGQLADLHRFTYQQMGDELLWPLSMPCFVGGEADIRIAEYGSSNIGKMKTLYRKGLHHRYGSVMQVIAGVHFNFSLPAHFWQQWHQWQAGAESLQQSQSDGYLAMIRNYRRLGWLVPYLFGASPALCGSFLQQKNSALPFEKLGQGTYYLPYATSLRMSDLGYTNRAQARLQVDYNSLTGYLASVDRALHTPEPRFAEIGVKVDGDYRQLNSNLLQIENELYAPIRPKRVAESGEKPSEALSRGGIEYIEVRALDVSPFHTTGVSADEIRFLDVMLVYCLLQESPVLDCDGLNEAARNITTTVLYGRDPNAQIEVAGQPVALKARAQQLLTEMRSVAEVMDKGTGGYHYQAALAKQLAKVENPDLTPSARLLNEMQQRAMDNGCLGMQYAESHKAALLVQQESHYYSDDELNKVAKQSVEAQQQIEANSTVDFDQFLADYFA